MDPFDWNFKNGTKFWPCTYKRTAVRENDAPFNYDDDAAYRGLCNVFLQQEQSQAFAARMRRTQEWTLDPNSMRSFLWASKWVDGGCRTLVTDATYFAAMAFTNASKDATEELRIPWPAFALRLPQGTIVGADGADYTLIQFAQFTNMVDDDETPRPSVAWICAQTTIDEVTTEITSLHMYKHGSLADLLFEDVSESVDDQFDVRATRSIHSPGDERIREMIRRATVGLLYTMQHTKNWSYGSHLSRPGHGARDRRCPPPHRTIIIGHPISVDLRKAVLDDAASGEHSAPSVQTLVRGHLKRQVCGVGRSARKVIWVEPYWRGPEDAPILARPYALSK